MRPFLLFLLASYHAFAPYCGAWPMPEGINNVEMYKWIALFSRAFRLEAFVFISGYIFTFQLLNKDKFKNLYELAINKANRLLVPCILFGLLYYILFRNVSNLGNPFRIITGIAHLWYLPCLFWLFIMQFIAVKRLKIERFNTGGVILIVVLLQSLSVLPLPFQLNRAFYYYLFFYLGGLFFQNSEKIKNSTSHPKTIVAWCIFIILVFAINFIIDRNKSILQGSTPYFAKVCFIELNSYLKSVLAVVGITAFYMTATLYCSSHSIGSFAIKIGSCGYGVYIFHQFILVHLYRQTELPEVLGTYWLPWMAMLIAIIGSILLTVLLRMTKLGRKYL